MTKEERIAEMENQKVLNDRLGPSIRTPVPYLHEPEVRKFYYKMELLEDVGIRTSVKNIKIFLDEETLGFILGVPARGIRSIEGCKPSSEFSKQATKRGDIKRAGLPNKFLKGEYQLLFEFISKAKHGIPYGYLLNYVFNHFEVPLGRGVPGTTKQMFTAATLLECECVDEKTKGRSQVADVLEQQATLKRELTDLCDPK
ncbi:hypothetical protein KY284_036405 [Solanum tuberosum]|nr:hypothetical protein KY284_036405 [Solanum tuberosum]